ncbi:IclR family transcriptional regulator [Nocardia rhamnosiphila]|uniref:IclR family transcriptional regulator n=1 Tax=Nocardia rhamnosiphila TaxID=426716 RepID=UPI0006921A92|nr:IclR family transcriptional regulator [Nocardia rhamnosiphila]
MTRSIPEPLRDDRAAVDKAISLLAAFGYESSTGIGVSELARRAQLSKSTAHRVLGVLQRNDIVERFGTNYRLGSRLHRLVQPVCTPENERMRDLMLPFLTELYEVTHQTVHLAVLHGTDVVYLAKLYGHRCVPTPSRIGGRLPAHATAVGKALLAYHPVAAGRALSAPLPSLTPRTVTDAAQLESELSTIRRRGVSFDDQEGQLGLACLAVPVFDGPGRAIAALSISGKAGHLDVGGLEARLRRICAEASRVSTLAHLRGVTRISPREPIVT